ncbi:hypothetical protein Acor_44200 [Acrocarpospora corrugata]|uniref:CU044_5270 family protein n=1 Tax=Acrocarpospora corrugata TaxID=35763 RepID=A0A5M3W0U5_9ACTN|nr:hypothetical protein [Acrocarpospora corrugata]GES02354.1 hypothetical protein Acor_44200 [Acrocarpospora corrugata]
MNEIDLINSVMPDVPPDDPVRTAETRARILAARRRPRFGWLVPAIATAVLSVAIAAVPQLIRPAGPHPVDPVAEVAERASGSPEPTTGRYWRVEYQEYGLGPLLTGNYQRLRTDVVEWRGAGQLIRENRLAAATPLAEADRVAWENCPKDCPSPLTSLSEKTRFDIWPGSFMVRSGQGLDVRPAWPSTGVPSMEFPGDPAELRAKLLTYYRKPHERDGDSYQMDWLWGISVNTLAQLPVTHQTRGAFYRLLADLPGVQVRADADTVVLTRPEQMGGTIDDLVIDRATGRVAALRAYRKAPGPFIPNARDLPGETPLIEMVFSAAGWTDDSPKIPPGCEPTVPDPPTISAKCFS